MQRQKRGYETYPDLELELDAGRPRSARAFNDELWDQEWYLVTLCTQQACAYTPPAARVLTPSLRVQQERERDAQPRLDLNVLPVYRLGITGRGVRVAVLDDGLEYTHEDLRSNYVSPAPAFSIDVRLKVSFSKASVLCARTPRLATT